MRQKRRVAALRQFGLRLKRNGGRARLDKNRRGWTREGEELGDGREQMETGREKMNGGR